MCIHCVTINLSIPPLDLEAELKRIAKLISDGKIRSDEIDSAMVKKIAKQLMAGVKDGYGTISTAVDKSFLKQIENNVYVFSGFKNHQMLREASLLLSDDAGVLKPFNSFLNDVKAISNTYNEVYLNAEYGNAVASMQAAASWNDFVELGVEMLRFQSINDDRTRPEHSMMDGTTVPIDDPLLNTYYTPLDWGCRCEWVPAVGETRKVNTDLPTVPPMFQTNVAKTGILFPDTHPYFNVPATVAQSILKQVDEIKASVKTEITEEPNFYPKELDAYQKELGITLNKEIFTLLNEPIPVTGKSGSAFYSPSEKRVNLPINSRNKASKWQAEAVVYHEYAHAADWQKQWRTNPLVTDLMGKYRKLFAKNGRSEYQRINMDIMKLYNPAFYDKNRDRLEQLASAADTLMSLNPAYGFGHTKKYFSISGKKEAEFIAHIFENKFIGNSAFKELMPDLYEDTIKLANQLAQTK